MKVFIFMRFQLKDIALLGAIRERVMIEFRVSWIESLLMNHGGTFSLNLRQN